MNAQPRRFETARLSLRGLCADDVPRLGRLHSDPRVNEFLNVEPMTEAEATRRAATHWQSSHDGRFGIWAIEERDGGAFAGWACLKPLENGSDIEIGYRLMPDAWGRGIATEAASCLLKHGFEDLALPSVTAVTDPRNAASENVLLKLGLSYVGLCTAYGFMFARLFRRWHFR